VHSAAPPSRKRRSLDVPGLLETEAMHALRMHRSLDVASLPQAAWEAQQAAVAAMYWGPPTASAPPLQPAHGTPPQQAVARPLASAS
jgi:hypothetical protein